MSAAKTLKKLEKTLLYQIKTENSWVIGLFKSATRVQIPFGARSQSLGYGGPAETDAADPTRPFSTWLVLAPNGNRAKPGINFPLEGFGVARTRGE
jgi:hypothetical protein